MLFLQRGCPVQSNSQTAEGVWTDLSAGGYRGGWSKLRNEKAFAFGIDGVGVIALAVVRNIDRGKDHDLTRGSRFQNGSFDIDRSRKQQTRESRRSGADTRGIDEAYRVIKKLLAVTSPPRPVTAVIGNLITVGPRRKRLDINLVSVVFGVVRVGDPFPIRRDLRVNLVERCRDQLRSFLVV